MDEVYEFLKQCGTYYLATVEDGQPRVRPFGTVDRFDGALYIQSGRSKAVFRQIESSPRIELCAFDGKRWLRLAATARADNRIEAETHMLDAYPHLRGRYEPGDGNNVVLRLEEVTATFSSFTEPPRTIRF